MCIRVLPDFFHSAVLSAAAKNRKEAAESSYILRKAYKYALKPKPLQCADLDQALGTCRWLWNKLLALNLARLRAGHALLWYQEMCWLTVLWKKSDEYAFLRTPPSQCLQKIAKDLDRAFRDAFDKNQPLKRLPVFKKQGRNEASLYFPQGYTVDEGNQVIQFPKIGWVKYKRTRKVEGEVKNVIITSQYGKHAVSLQTQRSIPKPVHPSRKAVGIDVGIVRFASLSDGQVIHAPRAKLKALAALIAKMQVKLARMQKFSENWKAQKAKIARLHARIVCIRQDFLHKTSI